MSRYIPSLMVITRYQSVGAVAIIYLHLLSDFLSVVACIFVILFVLFPGSQACCKSFASSVQVTSSIYLLLCLSVLSWQPVRYNCSKSTSQQQRLYFLAGACVPLFFCRRFLVVRNVDGQWLGKYGSI